MVFSYMFQLYIASSHGHYGLLCSSEVVDLNQLDFVRLKLILSAHHACRAKATKTAKLTNKIEVDVSEQLFVPLDHPDGRCKMAHAPHS